MAHRTQSRCQNHRFYLMSCEDFDALELRGGACCEICSVPVNETPHRMLHIDHDSTHGYWAVRGLLCSRCNTQLHPGGAPLNQDRVAAYLAGSWYLERLATAGVSAMPVEPPAWVVLKDGKGARWSRVGGLWVSSDRRSPKLDWRRLVRVRGPHLLTPV